MTEQLAEQSDIRHGTYAGFQRGCRCEDCRAARKAYRNAWDQRTGSNRRVGKRAEQKRAADAKRKGSRS